MSADTAPTPSEHVRPLQRGSRSRSASAPRRRSWATYVLGLVVPFCVYWSFDERHRVRHHVRRSTWSCVATLVSTGVMILVEAWLAVKQKEPPEVDEYPEATAIICAYLPNEARHDHGHVGCVPDAWGIRAGSRSSWPTTRRTRCRSSGSCDRLAEQHPNLDVVRVEGSTSKAQNVNAVLHMATRRAHGHVRRRPRTEARQLRTGVAVARERVRRRAGALPDPQRRGDVAGSR